MPCTRHSHGVSLACLCSWRASNYALHKRLSRTDKRKVSAQYIPEIPAGVRHAVVIERHNESDAQLADWLRWAR